MKNSYIELLRNYVLCQKKDFLLACLVTILKSMVMVSQPLAYKILVDKALPNRNVSLFLISLSIMMGCYMSSLFLNIAKDYQLAKISETLVYKLRTKLNNKISHLDYQFFDSNGVGDTISKYNKEVNIIKSNCGYMLLEIVGNILTFSMAAVMICIIDWKLIIITGFIFVMYILTNRYYGKKVQLLAEKSMDCNKEATGVITENFVNVMVTKIYSLYNKVNNRFNKKYENQFRNQMKLELTYSLNINLSAFWIYLLTAFVWIIGGFQICYGVMTLGTLIALTNYQNILISPMNFFCRFNNGYQETCIAINRLKEVLDYKEENRESKMEPLENNIDSIIFSNMSFQYCNREEVLDNINMQLEKGKVYAFLGESGCGKSTIAKLLVGLYTPTTGNILINHNSILDIGVEYLRSKIGYVPQDSLFYEDSIINNIKYDDKIKDDALIEMSKNLDLYDEILHMPNKWDTILNSGTTNVSGGQKKRIDLLRMFLKNSDVLIFDESTASLDIDRRKLLFNYIGTIKKDKIIIFITHNTEECEYFDTIYTIKNKNVFEISNDNNGKEAV